MQLYFNKIVCEPFNEFIPYTSLNPIPVIIKFFKTPIISNTIYARNLAENNFIEFSFYTRTRKLYELAVVNIIEGSVKLGANDFLGGDEFYECYIEEDSELEISKPISILRSDKSLIFLWNEQPSKTYQITKNCMLGIDSNNNLCAVMLINLNTEIIYQILGF
ncbi:hypothetical protein ACE38W_01015 [Chitinophaga sp. Hz27]|uniref:hypothetical protein n=1 Tax=Chitinophaga sp. Hz27 TaxID=3347169 RepID=UPI0035E1A12A